MQILVTGSKGQLGQELFELSKYCPEYEFIFTDVDELDITSIDDVLSFFNKNKIDVIINTAAYTNVNKAEDDKESAYLVNAEGPKNLAIAAKINNSFLIHISTDFVFGNKKNSPYIEDDMPNPLNIYGETKYIGEKFVMANADSYFIIRTSWLYSKNGNNFVNTMLKLFREKETVSVVYDQIGTPTYAYDLAKAIFYIIPKIKKHNKNIYHYSNEGVASWYDFACAILEFSDEKCLISPVTSDYYKSKVVRPNYSVLSKEKIRLDLGVKIRHWQQALKVCLGQ